MTSNQISGGAATSTFNLDGGTLVAGQIIKGTGGSTGTQTFNFDGGTLKSSASSTTYMTGLTNAFVKSGGAVIDTQAFNVTIGQNLLTDGVSTGGGLTKSGSGTLTLSGSNTYTGTTLISGGTLKLDATGTINNTSEVSLGTVGTFDVSAKGLGYTVGTLKGSGNVAGALTVSTQLAIGNSPGTTNFSSSLTLGSASTYLYDLTGGATPGLNSADLGDIAGALTITAGSILDLVQLATYTAGNKFTLFAYDGLLTGTFKDTSSNVLSDGATFTDAGGLWMIDYNDTTSGANGGVSASNTFVTITAVPEPDVAALLGGLGVLALLRRRR
jgi:autotransporter-associated beta strand protein